MLSHIKNTMQKLNSMMKVAAQFFDQKGLNKMPFIIFMINDDFIT